MDAPFFNLANVAITGGDATGLETLSGEYSLTAISGGTLTNAGTTGSTTRKYFWKVVLSDGREAFSPVLTTTTANATLTVGNYTTVACDEYDNAFRYYLYRSVSAGSPSTTGLIAETDTPSVNDTGLAAAAGVDVPDRSSGGALATIDTLRVGDYSGDENARLGVQGDVDVNGAVRSTAPDGWWTTGAGVELQYVSGVGYVMAYDRDTSAFKPVSLNYAGNAVTAPVLVGLTGGWDTSGAYLFQVGGGALFNVGDVKITGATSIPSGGSVWLPALATTKTIVNLTGANSAVASLNTSATFTQTGGANSSSLYGGNHTTAFVPTSTGGAWTQSTAVGSAVFAYFAGTMTNNATVGISTLIAQSTAIGMNGASPTGLVTLASSFEIGSFLKSATGSPSVTISNNRGLTIQDQGAGSGSGGLTITSAQGLAIATQTLATNRYDLHVGATSIPVAGAWSILQSSATRSAFNGKVYFGASTDPTARIHIAAGTTGAGTAPLKLTAGTNMSVVENGAFEFDGTNLFFTAAGTRRTISWV
jgi:hypothetical protein